MKIFAISLLLAFLAGCSDDSGPAAEGALDDALCVAGDPDCVNPPPACYPWQGTMYPDCATRSCPLGVSDEPLRYTPCADRGGNTLCFCRSTDETYPVTLCGRDGNTWIPGC